MSTAPVALGDDLVAVHITNFIVQVPGGFYRILPGTDPVRFAADTSAPIALDFQELTDEGWQTLGTGDILFDGQFHSTALLGALGLGTHHLRAFFAGNDTLASATSDVVDLDVTKSTAIPGLELAPTTDIEVGTPLPLRANISPYWDGTRMPSGEMSINEVETSTVLAHGPAAGPVNTSVTYATPGTRTLVVTYPGDSDYEPSTSDSYVIHVLPNVVHATAVGVNYTTFYPVKDGYRDTLRISGVRDEVSSVTIKVYSPAGKLLKTQAFASGTGAYAYAWTGRTSSGTVLAAGKYKVTQTIRDATGLSKTWTAYTSISKKKLVTKTKYVTKKGSAISVKGDPGSGTIAISKSGGYAKLKAVYPTGWVGIGYVFALPSATAYSSLSFQVYNKGYLSAPLNEIALQNFTACPYSATTDWDLECFDHFSAMGSGGGAKFWDKTPGSVTTNRSGTKVRGVVSMNYGTAYVYSVRIRVVYKVLV